MLELSGSDLATLAVLSPRPLAPIVLLLPPTAPCLIGIKVFAPVLLLLKVAVLLGRGVGASICAVLKSSSSIGVASFRRPPALDRVRVGGASSYLSSDPLLILDVLL